MAEDFPISLTQLLPLLEVVGNANKHIARVGKFLHKYGDMSLFPVKLQVSLTRFVAESLSNFKVTLTPCGICVWDSRHCTW